jgi:hypothetical protein
VRLPTDVVGRNTLNAVIKLSGLQGRAPITGNVFSSEECQCLKCAKKLRWVCTFNGGDFKSTQFITHNDDSDLRTGQGLE